MGFLDWTVRDVLILGAGVILAAIVTGAGFYLTTATLEVLGAPFPDDSEAANLGQMLSVAIGILVGLSLGLQLKARRPLGGVVHAIILGAFTVCAGALTQAAMNSISNEILSMLVGLALMAIGLPTFFLLWRAWVKKNPWLAAQFGGRSSRID